MPPWLRLSIGGSACLFVGMGIGRFSYTPLIPALIEAADLTVAEAGYVGAFNLAGFLTRRPRRARPAGPPGRGAEPAHLPVGGASQSRREHFALGVRVARLLALRGRRHGLGDDDLQPCHRHAPCPARAPWAWPPASFLPGSGSASCAPGRWCRRCSHSTSRWRGPVSPWSARPASPSRSGAGTRRGTMPGRPCPDRPPPRNHGWHGRRKWSNWSPSRPCSPSASSRTPYTGWTS